MHEPEQQALADQYRALADDALIKLWMACDEEPCAADEILLAEIERRNLDF